MCNAPAQLVGLGDRKGRIAAGFDADLILFDPDADVTVRADMLLHRHPLSPYVGKRLRGAVEATYVRGVLAFDRSTGPVETPLGELIGVRVK
jgi:allantoinase